MPIPPSLITFLVGMVLVLAGLWLGQNVSLLPLDASQNAPVYDELFKVLFSIGSVLFIGILGLLIFSLVRFRRRPGDTADGAPIEGNLPLEIVWTAIPAIVVLFIGIYSYDIYERMGGMTPLNEHSSMVHSSMSQSSALQEAAITTGVPSPSAESRVWGGIGLLSGENALIVNLTALQFAFIFNYPGASITSGELHVPVNQPVELRMKANDVIHAFWVPQFRLKQDIIPGQQTILTFTATRPGTYPIVCAELCGPYHGGMRSSVVVHEPEDFDAWLQKNSPIRQQPAAVAQFPTQPIA
ncbi:MAG: cytochrome c oxidase subunit II [Cyanobacteriota bacterium]|nr:cytochrome c oxidase subunit II [Cyanobacteriota bacterium]